MRILTPAQLDRLLQFPRGRCLKLAKNNELPHIDIGGEIRFDAAQVADFLRQSSKPAPASEVAHAR